MALQQIQLDQSIYQKPSGWGSSRQPSPYSQALTPQKTGVSGGAMPSGEGFMAKMDKEQALAEERKYQEKMMKLQHEQQMEKMKFAARLEEDVRKKARYQELSDRNKAERVALFQQQTASKQQIESNPEPAAKEMYELMKTLPDESKQQLLQQIFTPTSSGGTISSGGKTIQTTGKLNPIANVFLEKGWAMMDTGGKPTLSDPERVFEKGTFKEDSEGNIINEATGETIVRKKDISEKVDGELIADAYNYGSTYMGRLTDPTLLEKINPDNMTLYMENAKKESQLATMNYLLGQGIDKKAAKDIAYSVPIGERKTTTTPEPEPTTGKNAPLDEEKAKGLAEYLKNNPDTDVEAYRDRDGDATVDRALEINKQPTTTTTKTTKTTKEGETEEEPTGEGGTSSAIKEALKKYKPL